MDYLSKYKKEIELRKRNGEYTLGGKTGFCFIEGSNIVKIYNNPINIHNHVDLSNYQSKRISFPINYLNYKGYIIGEVMPYYNIDTLDNTLNLRTNVDSLRKSFCEIREEIVKFPNIMMLDLWPKNILFSSRKGMYLIDVTDWKLTINNYSDTNIKYLCQSMRHLSRQIIYDDGIAFTNMDKYYNFLHNSKIGNELLHILLSYEKRDYVFLELIDVYKEFIRIYYNYEIKTLSDIKKYTKIMKFS